MTNQQHPITPPPDLVGQWLKEWGNTWSDERGNSYIFTAVKAAKWGADQQLKLDAEQIAQAYQAGANRELELCCEWAKQFNYDDECYQDKLRFARRPKPPSLKEQALDELHISFDRGYLKEGSADIIRRALNQLPDS
jgi:hypothetical protein